MKILKFEFKAFKKPFEKIFYFSGKASHMKGEEKIKPTRHCSNQLGELKE